MPQLSKMPRGNERRETRRNVREARFRREDEPKEFDQVTLELARVTRVTKGGKRMRFRACVVIGDRRGRVGYGIAKGADVSVAVNKAARKAQKRVIRVPLVNETIPHVIRHKYRAAIVLLKPAPKGTGVKAGGAARVVLELAGVPNVVSKLIGSKNKINNVRATMAALEELSPVTKRRAAVQAETTKPTRVGSPTDLQISKTDVSGSLDAPAPASPTAT